MGLKRKGNFSGGYAKKARSMRRKPKRSFTAAGRSKIAKICKSVILKTAEPKFKNYDWTHTELYHNTFTVKQINHSACMPIEGDNSEQRVGDRINATGYLLRALVGQKADRPNCTFKYYVVSTSKGNAYSYASFFHDTMNNVLLDSINKDYCKVLKSGTIKKNIGTNVNGTDEYTFPLKIWVPYKKLIKFGPGYGATIPQENDIFLMIAPYDAWGTLITDNIAYFDCTQTLYYRDP